MAAIEATKSERIQVAGIASTDDGAPQGAIPDRYMDAVLKMIPAEIIAGFLAVDGIVRGSAGITSTTYWFVFSVLVLICAGYLHKVTTSQLLPNAISQVLWSTVGFVVWAYGIGGPFEFAQLSWYNPALGGIAVVLFTLTAPLFVRR